MKILITGSKGFVGKNLVASLQCNPNYEIYEYDIENDINDLKVFTSDCDFVIHLAGVNRPKKLEDFYEGNAGFTDTLCKLLKRAENKSPILISSSIQAEYENDYGKSKRQGEELLYQYGMENGVEIYQYRFANLFGKWCKPNYNSVVATWCYNIANNKEITINDEDFLITLCYIDDVVEEIINAIQGFPTKVGDRFGVSKEYSISLGELSKMIKSFALSRENLYIPSMVDALTKKLYSTYLSYLPKENFIYPLKMNIDTRGSFTEFLKTEGYGQVSVNISKPGIIKGNHWHHTKNEKFLVVSGKGLIQFRNIFNEEIIKYAVSSEKLEVIDIPVGYTHNIVNIGDCDLVTIMWANEEFNPDHADTFYKEV